MSDEAKTQDWLNQRERGSVAAISLVFKLATWFGRFLTRLIMAVVSFYYVLTDRNVRVASRAWLGRVHGRPARFSEVFGHVRRFVNVTLDRIYLLMGKTHYFEFKRTGSHHLRSLAEERKGAVLLGAHLGSFEAMRATASGESWPLNIVGHFDNAKMINALFARLNPDIAARVVHTGKDPVGTMTALRARVEEGEMVAILGDRVGLNDKTVTVDFFGQPARFAAGPFLLASLLRCPVYLVFGLYFEPNQYELYCEPLTDQLILPRKGRQQALREVVQQYADRVEHFCRRAPDNWFNFYDFWEVPTEDGEPSGQKALKVPPSSPEA